MSAVAFDAAIALHKRQLVVAGLSDRQADAVAAVRSAVEDMDGAGWLAAPMLSNTRTSGDS
jgi:hypothetical protein